MPTEYAEIFAALAAPFDRSQVKQRNQGNRSLDYITARTAMNRLDEVLGPENWEDDYESFLNGHAVKCYLTITLPDGRQIKKTGIGGITEMHDTSDTDKTAESDSIKRAAVKFGIARYLYKDGVPEFVRDKAPMPSSNDNGHDPSPPQQQQQQQQRIPRNGRALFAWTKDMEKQHNVALLKYLNDWSKHRGFADRMVDWDEAQVAEAYDEAQLKLNGGEEAPEQGIEDLRQRLWSLVKTIAQAGREGYQPQDRDIQIAMANLDDLVSKRYGDQYIISSIRNCQDATKLRHYIDQAAPEAQRASEVPA